MFDFSVQTRGLTELYGVDGAYRALREAGFACVDADINLLFPPEAVKARQPIPAFLQKGDVVVCAIEGIGELVNTVE